jgi:TolB protein
MRQARISSKSAISRRRVLIAGGAAAAVAGLRVAPARAALRLDITRGTVQPMPIALP